MNVCSESFIFDVLINSKASATLRYITFLSLSNSFISSQFSQVECFYFYVTGSDAWWPVRLHFNYFQFFDLLFCLANNLFIST